LSDFIGFYFSSPDLTDLQIPSMFTTLTGLSIGIGIAIIAYLKEIQHINSQFLVPAQRIRAS